MGFKLELHFYLPPHCVGSVKRKADQARVVPATGQAEDNQGSVEEGRKERRRSRKEKRKAPCNFLAIKTHVRRRREEWVVGLKPLR